MSGSSWNILEAPRVAKTTRSCGRLGTLERSPPPLPGSPILEYRLTLIAVAGDQVRDGPVLSQTGRCPNSSIM